jgi:HNH endonuclease
LTPHFATLCEVARAATANTAEYQNDSRSLNTKMDHVIAAKHGGQTVAGNLALCCTLCNRFKGSDIASVDPETGEITPLFHPRFDEWKDHYDIRDGLIVALTAKGRVTVTLLRMNRPDRIRERQLLRH